MVSHIHVEARVLEAGAPFRNLIAQTMGRAVDAPTTVTTGCGVDVPYAQTSTRPESVTCLPCRDHARTAYTRFAEQFERMGGGGALAGMNVTADQIAAGARRLRELADRYA